LSDDEGTDTNKGENNILIIDETSQVDLVDEIGPPSKERYTVVGINPGESLSIYSDPNESGKFLGEIPSSGFDLRRFGEPIMKENLPWIMIEYDQNRGWVNYKHLAEYEGELPTDVIAIGQQVLFALSQSDYETLVNFIHPDLCLRFSPYHTLYDKHQVFCAEVLPDIWDQNKEYLWGSYDGTGDPIFLSFPAYHAEFVYDVDYLHPEKIGFNVEVSSGNAINNISEFYPDSVMIEYYFSGFDPKYGGLDWRSLRLVFIPDSEHWYLVAIVHGEWTI
jgi:hypothetical protein